MLEVSKLPRVDDKLEDRFLVSGGSQFRFNWVAVQYSGVPEPGSYHVIDGRSCLVSELTAQLQDDGDDWIVIVHYKEFPDKPVSTKSGVPTSDREKIGIRSLIKRICEHIGNDADSQMFVREMASEILEAADCEGDGGCELCQG